MRARCKDCVFYITGKNLHLHGFCHRYPPIGIIGRWPQVPGKKWCGEFKQKPVRRKKKVVH
jgi:hypothetical protein